MSQFYNYIKSFGDKTVNIYIDMDGVVADYDFEGYINDGTKDDVYLNKRPVISSINPLKEVSQLSNVNLHILSVSRYERQINGKLTWLDKNMDFIVIGLLLIRRLRLEPVLLVLMNMSLK